MATKKIDPRQRMKEVREDVNSYLKGKKRLSHLKNLGEYPNNLGDARRTIIALQDLFDKEKDSHIKASNLIHSQIKEIEKLREMVAEINEDNYYLGVDLDNARDSIRSAHEQISFDRENIKELMNKLSSSIDIITHLSQDSGDYYGY